MRKGRKYPYDNYSAYKYIIILIVIIINIIIIIYNYS